MSKSSQYFEKNENASDCSDFILFIYSALLHVFAKIGSVFRHRKKGRFPTHKWTPRTVFSNCEGVANLWRVACVLPAYRRASPAYCHASPAYRLFNADSARWGLKKSHLDRKRHQRNLNRLTYAPLRIKPRFWKTHSSAFSAAQGKGVPKSSVAAGRSTQVLLRPPKGVPG